LFLSAYSDFPLRGEIRFVGGVEFIGAAVSVLDTKPSSVLSISAIELSDLGSRFVEGLVGLGAWGGQTEIKSPPGPNLHTGSACLCVWLFIFSVPAFWRLYKCRRVDNPTANISIGDVRMKTLTKTEQKSTNRKVFEQPCVLLLIVVII